MVSTKKYVGSEVYVMKNALFNENKIQNLNCKSLITDLASNFVQWNITATQVQIPVIFPHFVLHPLAWSPCKRNLFTMKAELVQVLQCSK